MKKETFRSVLAMVAFVAVILMSFACRSNHNPATNDAALIKALQIIEADQKEDAEIIRHLAGLRSKDVPVIAELSPCPQNQELLVVLQQINIQLTQLNQAITPTTSLKIPAANNVNIDIENKAFANAVSQVITETGLQAQISTLAAQVAKVKTTVEKNSGHAWTNQQKIDRHIKNADPCKLEESLAKLETLILGDKQVEVKGLLAEFTLIATEIRSTNITDPGILVRLGRLEDWVQARLDDETKGNIRDTFWLGKVTPTEAARSTTFPAQPLVVAAEEIKEVNDK